MMAVSAFKEGVNSGLSGDENMMNIRQQAMLNRFLGEVTYSRPPEYIATWPQPPVSECEEKFLTCILLYSLRRFVLFMPDAAKGLNQLTWKNGCFDGNLLQTLEFVDTMPSRDSSTATNEQFVSEMKENIKQSHGDADTKSYGLDAVEAISRHRVPEPGTPACRIGMDNESTVTKLMTGLLNGVILASTAKSGVRSERDKHILLICALMQEKVLIFSVCLALKILCFLIFFVSATSWHTILYGRFLQD